MKSKIHIQHVVLSLQPGGLENGVVNVVNRLDATRFRSSVCCLKQAGEFAARIRAEEAEIHQMGWRGGNDLLLPLRLARLFRRTKTDIVHTRNAEAFFYGFIGARLAGVQSLVHSEHGRTFSDRPIRFRLQRALSRYTDAVFAVSGQLKRDLVTHVGIPASRIEVLYNGVDPSRFVPAQRGMLRSQLGLKDDTVVIGSVGRLAAVKNYSLLLRAVHALAGDRIKILLVGDGPEHQALENMARTIGLGDSVIFVGHSDDVTGVLGAMDIFVLPSVSEGMSNTLLEAMAAGVPVVASNVGGTPEIVRDGVDGLLFESNDSDGLRDNLQKLLASPQLRARLGLAGQARVLKDFAIESMISRYEELYLSTLPGHGKRQ